jgi:hypothetical protein
VCGEVIEKNIRNRIDNINKTERLNKCKKICSLFRHFTSAYDKKIDLHDIFNPRYWLNFYNNSPEVTIEHLKKLNYLKRYFNPKSNVYLKNILNLAEIPSYELDMFIERIRKNAVDIDKLIQYNNLNSVNRWLVMGFSKEISNRLSNYFRTTQEGFILRTGSKKEYEKWRTKSVSNRKGVPEKDTNPLFLEYWFKKGFSLEDAEKAISLRNIRDLTYFINKYGVDSGTLKYSSMCEKRKKSSSLEGYIKKYGELNGREKFIKITVSKNVSLKKQIERYGDTIGKEKHNQRIDRMLNSYDKIEFRNGSKIANLFFSNLQNILNVEIEKEIIVGNKYVCDCIIKDKNLIIEFYGDYWHKNPLYFTENKERFMDYDQKRLDFLRQKYNVIIVWESCVKKIDDTLSLIKEKIIGNIFNFEVNFDGNILKIDGF